MTLKFMVFAVFGQEGSEIRKISLRVKNLHSFYDNFTLFQNFQFWTFWSFLANFPEPIFDFWHFGGQNFKKWKISQNMIKCLWKTKKRYFEKFLIFLNFWPQKCQKSKIGSGKSAKNDQNVQNWKFWNKVKLS